MGKLSTTEIQEYFKVHLPYRTRIMLAHYKMTHDTCGNPKAWTGNPAWLDACFVASLITARSYLHLLGVGKKSGRLCAFEPRQDDITVDDLGGRRIDAAKLPPDEQRLFLDFLTMADKAAAHLTVPRDHDWAKTHDVIKLIHNYLKTNLYGPASRTDLESLP
jgi:hypothetical protein